MKSEIKALKLRGESGQEDVVLADNVEVARGTFSRLKGLIGKDRFDEGSALVMPACRQIHTFFMKFPIDVVFLDAHNRVVELASAVPLGKITKRFPKAVQTIEFSAGTITEKGIRNGDLIIFER